MNAYDPGEIAALLLFMGVLAAGCAVFHVVATEWTRRRVGRLLVRDHAQVDAALFLRRIQEPSRRLRLIRGGRA